MFITSFLSVRLRSRSEKTSTRRVVHPSAVAGGASFSSCRPPAAADQGHRSTVPSPVVAGLSHFIPGLARSRSSSRARPPTSQPGMSDASRSSGSRASARAAPPSIWRIPGWPDEGDVSMRRAAAGPIPQHDDHREEVTNEGSTSVRETPGESPVLLARRTCKTRHGDPPSLAPSPGRETADLPAAWAR